jgi:hypothetical protein
VATVIEGNGSDRLVDVHRASTTTITTVEMTGGNAGDSSYGGAALNAGKLTIADDAVVDNSATAGGALANAGGTLSVTRSEVNDNDGVNYGGGGIQNGGIDNVPGTVEVIGSTVDDNTSGGDAGGILNGQNGHPDSDRSPARAPASFCPAVPACTRARPAEDASRPDLTSTRPLKADERGHSRPFGPACDIGAFEKRYTLASARAG